MGFEKESDFENSLIELLTHKGWDPEIIKYPTEEDLLKNWADILFENNRVIDRLNDYPLTDGEMQQLIEQIKTARTPLKLNGFINGKTVSIIRDNPDDKLHFGKEVSLKIYDRLEIAAGQSRYQIAEQPKFKAKNSILPDRRGDFMLLINGMPVIHVELKKSGIPVSQATSQIEKYAHEGVFTGLFSLVQIFVAMNPEETLYFANPGPEGKFNKDFYFHWADFNNEPINDWKQIADKLLSIPMAHQMIGFYTVADDGDGCLKVMRSYQYYASNAISDRVSKIHWDGQDRLGGYVWHTTGSGKTMTSFKSAQLISNSKDADKVIFLMDRIELGTQSLKEYRNFADETDDVQATEDTIALIGKLKSDAASDTLIVTSIQKMSNIKNEDGGRHAADIIKIGKKRLVFIVDECHRSTFGTGPMASKDATGMLLTIKETFPNAVFFGFTGTPILDENQKKKNTTSDIFGSELHRYSIADGIRDKNVLGFDPYKVLTFADKDVREVIALEKAKADSVVEALADPTKAEVYYKYMDPALIPMAGDYGDDGKYIKGIEDYLGNVQYKTDEHTSMVVKDIKENWLRLSHGGKFHAIFATSSIPEAIEYYRLIKKEIPELKVTGLFDPSIDNNGGAVFKEDGLVEIIEDYNKRYDQSFSLKSGGNSHSYAMMKKDIAARLAHKDPYLMIERTPEKQLDLLIVVDQMLTGFDSKWVNTLYMDKVLRYENIIQAFSRTNRIYGEDKPFGTIRYYRYPHTMEKNIEKAIKLYSGDKPAGLFVQKLEHNLKKLNDLFRDIKELFESAGVENFEKLPPEKADRGKFALLFKNLNDYLEAALIQGFTWRENEYMFTHDDGSETEVQMEFDETTYLILVMRYKELFGRGPGPGVEEVPYDIEPSLIEIDTGRIDTNYMNSKFEKYLWILTQHGVSPEEVQRTLDELHKSFAVLSQSEQKYANIFLHDVESGRAQMESGKTFRDYIVIYETKTRDDHIRRLVERIGVYEEMLRAIMGAAVNENNINEFGRFDELKATVDKEKARAYFEKKEHSKIPMYKVNMKADKLLRDFIISGGFNIDENEEDEVFAEDLKKTSSLNESVFSITHGYSVTQRIDTIRQPYGGYINPSSMEEIKLGEGINELGTENVHASLIGLAVDYLTRMMTGTYVREAFSISLAGADRVGHNLRSELLVNRIDGLTDDSITAAVNLVRYDVCVRNTTQPAPAEEEIAVDSSTINNIRTMVNRSVNFLRKYGPKVLDGFTFEGGYTDTIASGDGDFITGDTLWDFKVSKNPPTNKHTLQLLVYWRMGLHSIHQEFKSIKYLGIYNPRLNTMYRIDVASISDETIEAVERDVIGY